MNMKDYLNKIIASRSKSIEDLRAKIKASESADEVRALGETLQTMLDELNEAKAKLDEIDKNDEDNKDEGDEGAPTNEGEGESASRSAFNPMKAIGGTQMRGNQISANDNAVSTMEERQAFMNYYLRGEKSEHLRFEKRDDATGTTTNLGVLIPQTIIQEIIKDMEKVRGVLYGKVRKLNVKGGVKFPIGSFSATFHRITETTTSDRQNAGGVTDSIVFTYKIGEIRLARTLLQTVLSVPVFEQEFAKVVVEAYVEAMDKEIMVGDPDDEECNGILTEAAKVSGSRIPAANIIEFTEADMADWTKWQTNLFAKIPLAMRGARPEFVMTSGTYEANIKTLKDNNNRPLYNETFNPVDGDEVSTFKGKIVAFVEDDVLPSFDDADADDIFGMYWVPNKAYAINSNLEFAVRDYYDEETNQFVKKATVINDGNVLDGKYIYLLKKVAANG